MSVKLAKELRQDIFDFLTDTSIPSDERILTFGDVESRGKRMGLQPTEIAAVIDVASGYEYSRNKAVRIGDKIEVGRDARPNSPTFRERILLPRTSNEESKPMLWAVLDVQFDRDHRPISGEVKSGIEPPLSTSKFEEVVLQKHRLRTLELLILDK